MERELRSITVMGILLAGSQIAALAIAPLFAGAGMTAFQNPNDVSNTLIYIIMILAFTAVILALVKYRRQNLARYLVLGSVFITIAFVLLLPLYYGLYGVAGLFVSAIDNNLANNLGNLATILAFAAGALVTWIVVKYPEWYVVDTVGLVPAAGVTAIVAISFGWFPAFLLLVAIGFAFVLQNAPANSLLQHLVPDHLRGRVMALYVSLFLGLMRVGGLLIGVLAAATSAPFALAVLSGAGLLVGLWVCLRFPELRRSA